MPLEYGDRQSLFPSPMDPLRGGLPRRVLLSMFNSCYLRHTTPLNIHLNSQVEQTPTQLYTEMADQKTAPSMEMVCSRCHFFYSRLQPGLTTTQKGHLLSLPPELRNRIWSYLVIVETTFTITNQVLLVPGILRTCRQIRKEALGMFLELSTFRVGVDDCDRAWTDDCLSTGLKPVIRSARAVGIVDVKDIKIKQICYRWVIYGTPNWANLLRWMKTWHANGKTGFGDGTEEDSPFFKVIVAATKTIAGMKGKQWSEVEAVLEGWHVVLTAMDSEWQ